MKKIILNQLELLPFFTKRGLSAFENIHSEALNQNMKRWVKSGLLIRLKNGLYVTKTFLDRSHVDSTYPELLANTLVFPSYLSMEYVLQKHGLLTETTYAITSATTKSTRRYTNAIGTFQYRTLSKNLYFGFETRRCGKNVIVEASLAKALFDYLYLRLPHLHDRTALDELRINWAEMGKPAFSAFCDTVNKSGIKRMMSLLSFFEELFHGDAPG